MCRALAYLGDPIPLAYLLYRPEGSLVAQSIDPQQLHMLNLAGFGMACWNEHDADPDVPLTYRSTTVPVYDANLTSLSTKRHATCLLAHVRGVAYRSDAGFGPQNLHPFLLPGCRLALAHNGDLSGFARMKLPLAEHIRPELRTQITGTTDSEWVYALLLSQLDDVTAWHSADELLAAVDRTLRVLRSVREQVGIDTSSSLNLFLSDGQQQIAVRFTFDFGRYPLEPAKVHEANARFLSLWYTTGGAFEPRDGRWGMWGSHPRAAILASEPLTHDTTGWVEVPEYSAVVATRSRAGVQVRTQELDA